MKGIRHSRQNSKSKLFPNLESDPTLGKSPTLYVHWMVYRNLPSDPFTKYPRFSPLTGELSYYVQQVTPYLVPLKNCKYNFAKSNLTVYKSLLVNFVFCFLCKIEQNSRRSRSVSPLTFPIFNTDIFFLSTL